ncbi:C-type lectin domain family 4 member E-like [Mytilus californianus]|uniref:C-type lectin domain family 4 member E-like n=1 Tax=Mytilus californianus TaxID=6549 RepID=UPI002247523F|nr:C-type lectin domain family 4 member E-like [Mytilus californianus]
MSTMFIVCFLYILTVFHVCKADENTNIQIPLMDNVKAPLFADLNLSNVTQQLKRVIQQEVKRSIQNRINDSGNCDRKIDAMEKTLLALVLNYTNTLNQLTPTVETIASANCQKPYQKIGNGCYFISNDKVSGNAAFASCTDPGAYLANFETLEEAMALTLFIQKQKTGIHYYVGGRNINRYLPNGDWRWIKNGKVTKMTYFAFAEGQPSGTAKDEQDCMFLYANNKYQFYDIECDKEIYYGGYICEK